MKSFILKKMKFPHRAISILSIAGIVLGVALSQPARAESYLFVEVNFNSDFAKGGVYEYYGVIFQEKNGSLSRAFTSRPIDGTFRFTVPTSEEPWKLGFSILEPGAEKTNEASQGFYSQKNNVGVTSLRTSQPIKINKDLTISVKLPVSQKRISLRVVDASGNLVGNSFSQATLTGKYLFSQSGYDWELDSSVLANGENTFSSNGTFQYYFYEGTSISFSVSDKTRSSVVVTPRSIKVSNDENIVICLPINFPTGVRNLSQECLQVQMEQELQAATADAKAIADKAVADRAYSEAETKSAANAALKILTDQVTSSKEDLTQKIRILMNRYPSERSKLMALLISLLNFPTVTEANYRMLEGEIYRTMGQAEVIEERMLKKRTTITCVKGKLTKKVTAVKPKCPTGYKVKK